MTEPTIEISTVDWSNHEADLLAIRRTVFIAEQNVPEHEEIDGLDPACVHVLVWENNQPIACARIKDDGKIGRVAVLASHRGTGLGAQIMEYCTQLVISWALVPQLDAQLQALPFYEKLGYVAYGPEFLDAGIPHRKMAYQPSDEPSSEQSAAPAPENYQREIAEFLTSARNQLTIVCAQERYSELTGESVIAELKRLLLAGQLTMTRVILCEPKPDPAALTAVVNLAKRLPSKLLIRCLQTHSAQYSGQATLTSGRRQLIIEGGKVTNQAHLSHRHLSPQQAEIEHDSFTRLWEHEAAENPYFRSLAI